MLRAIYERQGTWGASADLDAELEEAGRDIGLTRDETFRMLKHLIDLHRIDPGRILQAPGSTLEESGAQIVGTMENGFIITPAMKVTPEGEATMRWIRSLQGADVEIYAREGASSTEVARTLRQVADDISERGL